jgi:hypothetical protein
MAIQIKHPDTQPKKEHMFLPRAIGLISGIIAGVTTAKIYVRKKLHQWVSERIQYGDDPVVKGARQEIIDELASLKDSTLPQITDEAKLRHMKGMKETLEKLKTNFSKKRDQKYILEYSRAGDKADREIEKRVAKIPKGIPEEDFIRAKKTIEAEKKFLVDDAYETLKTKVDLNHKYFSGRAEAKVIHEEIIDRLGLHLRMAEGRKWVFIGGAVALGVVGYAGYKVADLVLNGKGGKHSEALINRRIDTESQASTNASIS